MLETLFGNSDVNLITHNFEFTCTSAAKVLRELKKLDIEKAPGPDKVDPSYLKLPADFMAEPLAYIFNSSLNIGKVWKSAFFIPLLNRGDPSGLNNYGSISKHFVLAKIFEKLVSDQLKVYLVSNSILTTFLSVFRKTLSKMTVALKVLNSV